MIEMHDILFVTLNCYKKKKKKNETAVCECRMIEMHDILFISLKQIINFSR